MGIVIIVDLFAIWRQDAGRDMRLGGKRSKKGAKASSFENKILTHSSFLDVVHLCNAPRISNLYSKR